MPLNEAAALGKPPSARSGHSCTALPAHLAAGFSPCGAEDGAQAEEHAEGLLIFGGFRGSRYGEHVTRDDMLGDVHLLLLSAPPRWIQLRPAGDPAQNQELPPPRSLHAACLVGSQLVITGGWGGGSLHADTWALQLVPPPTLPLGGGGGGGGGDVGGGAGGGGGGGGEGGGGGTFEPSWRSLTAAAPSGVCEPPRRQGHSAVTYGSRALLTFGGDSSGTLSADLWLLDTTTLMWHKLEPSGRRPAARTAHCAAMLPPAAVTGSHHGTMLICGGKLDGRRLGLGLGLGLGLAVPLPLPYPYPYPCPYPYPYPYP